MTSPAIEHEGDERTETVGLPATDAVQRALHEATGHLYDELAVAQVDAERADERLPEAVFEDLETLYVATAENAVVNVRISYDRA